MKRRRYPEGDNNQNLEFHSEDYQKCLPIFQRLGLKPRRYFKDRNAAYIGTIEGWYRLSFKKYNKQELKWLRRILEYLDERSFCSWAVPWQKTIIWEEHTFCYLIQPWLISNECFQASDPASISRIAEITTELYSCGKDYMENRGIEIVRDRWQTLDLEWETAIQKLDLFKNNLEHEKIRKEVDELRKDAISALQDSLNNWRKSGLSTLLEHHQRSGVLGHGNLCVKNIVWSGNDYHLLNWEDLAFQPRIVDIASLINDVAWWEPEWILFTINEYSKIQPFWPEEHMALFALMKYPGKIIELFNEGITEEDLDRRNIKEVLKELARKDRCLLKAWKELGTQKRWVWGRQNEMPTVNPSKISMVLSPVESWGDFTGQVDSLIQVKHDHKLPKDVMDRLTYPDTDRVVAGRDGNILESAAKENTRHEDHFVEIVEPQPKIPIENEPEAEDEGKAATPAPLMEERPSIEPAETNLPESPQEEVNKLKQEEINAALPQTIVEQKAKKAQSHGEDRDLRPQNIVKETKSQVIQWAKFPKPVGAVKKIGIK